MTMPVKLGLSCLGVFLTGAVGYYQLHSGPGVLVTTTDWWVGFIMAGLAPLAAYFVGLAQKSPWDAPPQGGVPNAPKP